MKKHLIILVLFLVVPNLSFAKQLSKSPFIPDSVQDEFNKFLEKSNKVIAIDFDGVIHNANLGYNDGTIYGKPIKGSLESIKKLSENHTLKIYSCKSNPKRPLINDKTGTELIWEWLENHGVKEYIDDVVWGKPNAVIYIDDNGYRFENWNDTLNTLNKLLRLG